MVIDSRPEEFRVAVIIQWICSQDDLYGASAHKLQELSPSLDMGSYLKLILLRE